MRTVCVSFVCVALILSYVRQELLIRENRQMLQQLARTGVVRSQNICTYVKQENQKLREDMATMFDEAEPTAPADLGDFEIILETE